MAITMSSYLTSIREPEEYRSSTGLVTTTASRPCTSRTSARPRTGISTIAGTENQQIICAVSESRGAAPTVGLAFINITTYEAVLCQICDNQTYVRTLQKICIFCPSEILVVSTAASSRSKLFAIIEEFYEDLNAELTLLDRKHWAETAGHEYIQQLAITDDLEAIKSAIAGNYFAVCCFAAAIKYVELSILTSLPHHSLRIKYEPSEGTMMIDISTIRSLELIENLQSQKSRGCLFGLLNQTLTPMGSRLLRNNILQPLTSPDTIKARYDAQEELINKEAVFLAVRHALQDSVDADRLLTSMLTVTKMPSSESAEQSINSVILLRKFISSVEPIWEALKSAQTGLLAEICRHCSPTNFRPVEGLIATVIEDDIMYSKSPLELRYQRTFAVRSGVNGLLDVARQTFKESSDDVFEYVNELKEKHGLKMELKYDAQRQYFLRLMLRDLDSHLLPQEFVNVIRRRKMIECTTLDLMKRNQKIAEAHTECIIMSNGLIEAVIDSIREHAPRLFKISESLAMLDMLTSFAKLSLQHGYVRPELGETLAIKDARHPIKEMLQTSKFVPNDVYATQQQRFQIITGCNMSGKSTYIRMSALLLVMAQIGSFVPASYASFSIRHQLFARINIDDSLDANVSTFTAEMQETAFILRNLDKNSIAIIDELGRGTSTRDGLAIAIAISEALIDSKAFVWFVTHFCDLPRVMAGRNGVTNLHLAVNTPDTTTMNMLYRVAPGPAENMSYGLSFARLVPFPATILAHATYVANALRQRNAHKRVTSATTLKLQRRKLILDLKEHLLQARASGMQGAELQEWLKSMQDEFVSCMAKLEEDVTERE